MPEPFLDPDWEKKLFVEPNPEPPRVTVPEIEVQYATLMEMVESHEGHDAGRLGFLVGAAYALKWVTGQEDGSEFSKPADATV